MKISQFLKAIEGVDPELDITNWLLARQASKIEILSVADTAKALPIIERNLGKPYQTANCDMSGKWLGYRRCVWKSGGVVHSSKAADELVEAGIKSFKITQGNYFTIFIPADLQVRDIKQRPNDIIWLEETRANRETVRLAEWKRESEERARQHEQWMKEFEEGQKKRAEEEKTKEQKRLKDLAEAQRKEQLRQEELKRRRLAALADPTEIKRDLAGD